MASLTTIIITRNEEANLSRLLNSCHWSNQIVIVDSGSTDRTRDIALEYRAQFVSEEWKGYTRQKNSALEKATCDWVLSVDADEELPAETQKAIRRIVAEDPPGIDGYFFRRKVLYLGRWITHGDWYPDEVLRLWRRGRGRFGGGNVHESVMVDGATFRLKEEILHYSYKDLKDQEERMSRYAALWAEDRMKEGRRTGPMDLVLRPAWRFFRGLILKRGFLDGWRGWLIAWRCARETAMKYRKLAELERGVETRAA